MYTCMVQMLMLTRDFNFQWGPLVLKDGKKMVHKSLRVTMSTSIYCSVEVISRWYIQMYFFIHTICSSSYFARSRLEWNFDIFNREVLKYFCHCMDCYCLLQSVFRIQSEESVHILTDFISCFWSQQYSASLISVQFLWSPASSFPSSYTFECMQYGVYKYSCGV